jgi:hypothetical protein
MMGEIEKGYVSLVAAIIEQAVTDYKEALKHCNDESQRVRENAEKMKKDCESFFLIEWGQMLSQDFGEHIIARCRREVAEEMNEKE